MSWREWSLGDLCFIQSGGTPRRNVAEYYGGSIPWVKIADITFSDGLITETEEYITESGLGSIGNRIFPEGTLLLAMYGSVGKVAVANVELTTNQAILGLQIRDERQLDSRFLLRYTESIQPYLLSIAQGVTQKNLSATIIRDLKLKVPPLEQQKRIARVLDKADELRAKRRRAVAKLDELLKSVFSEMFNGLVSRSWPVVTIDSLVAKGKNKIRTGPFGSQLLHSEFTEDASGVLVLGIDNAVSNRFKWGEPRFITHEKYSQLQRYEVFPDDVLITIMGTCGRVAIVPPEIPLAINSKHLCCITLDQSLCLPSYLKNTLLMRPDVLRKMGSSTRGAIMAGLNMGLIKGLKIPQAPIETQKKFQLYEQQIEIHKQELTTSLSKLDTLFSSLQARAFSGDLTPETPEALDEVEAVAAGS